ncbi:hypothetical protein R3P38DRAFT_2831102 [Favolaschia claudopus]|uniref:Uncharacterized protein n=1 Tax=Favolaschia claudopus TaxID=2862362 RepID=A0AAW0EBR2_9AGAR
MPVGVCRPVRTADARPSSNLLMALLGRRVAVAILIAVSAFSLHVLAAASLDPVPPLQWLKLTTAGTTQPPGLRFASVGYNAGTRTLIIFGGEAQSGVAQSQTYLLDLDSLTWSIPAPPVTLQQTPPARSAAVSGIDTAASNRNGFIVIGGKGSDGKALSDIWEFDFTNQFWAQVNISPGGPSPRWGSRGGIDTRIAAVSDPVLPGPNNTFWLLGGQDTSRSFSDLWRLNVSGTLSSNLPDSSVGSWEQISLSDFPGSVGQGGGVMSQQLITSGGCNDTLTPGTSCAVQNTYIVTSNRETARAAPALNCPVPRLSPTLVPNGNKFSSSFSSQIFSLFGSFNSSLWDDAGGSKEGEVAILDVNTRSWTRVLPSGDPGSSGSPSFPTPRDGAVAVMSPQGLVGDSPKTSSDIIVFGGRDASGNYLADLWLLRAYNGLVNSTHPKWSGFGNGQPQTGPNANGAGVENKFVTTCAVAIAPPPPPPSNSSSNQGGSQSGDDGSSQPNNPSPRPSLDTTFLHKLLAPLSVGLLLPAFLLFRLTSIPFNGSRGSPLTHALYHVSCFLGVVGYGLGVAGLVLAFTTLSSSDSTAKPSLLSTTHGQAGLALFILLYGLLFLLAILHLLTRCMKRELVTERKRTDSDVTEKEPLPRSTLTPSPAFSFRRQASSWGPSSWRKVREDSLSVDSGSGEMPDFANPPSAQRTFEVLNRPARTRRGSGSHSSMPLTHLSHQSGSQSLGDLDWLNRRRSLTAVDELDNAAPPPSTPGTLLEAPGPSAPNMPPPLSILLRFLFHASLAAFCIFCLVTLWTKSPSSRSGFGIFLAWTVAFYVTLFISSWRGHPDRSTLTLLFQRLRAEPQPRPAAPRPSISDTLPGTEENVTFPYTHHRPAYRRALLSEAPSPQSAESDEEDDDRAENEMRRRDVSFFTTHPKRALRITNPS